MICLLGVLGLAYLRQDFKTIFLSPMFKEFTMSKDGERWEGVEGRDCVLFVRWMVIKAIAWCPPHDLFYLHCNVALKIKSNFES